MLQLSSNPEKKLFYLAGKEVCLGVGTSPKSAKKVKWQLSPSLAKNNNGIRTTSEEEVVNFYVFINSYIPKLNQVMSDNLQGLSDIWKRRLNYMGKSDYIINSMINLGKIVSRKEDEIYSWKEVFGEKIQFLLVIGGTKVT